VLPALAQVLGGGQLVTHVAQSVSEMSKYADKVPFKGLVTHDGDPGVAATMSLLQQCKSDAAATDEAVRMRESKTGLEYLERAEKALAKARAAKGVK
jgi:ABC-type uncharacterized transport system YnjBCD substrate-binding protein